MSFDAQVVGLPTARSIYRLATALQENLQESLSFFSGRRDETLK
jgi:hypothetical protein